MTSRRELPRRCTTLSELPKTCHDEILGKNKNHSSGGTGAVRFLHKACSGKAASTASRRIRKAIFLKVEIPTSLHRQSTASHSAADAEGRQRDQNHLKDGSQADMKDRNHRH